MQEGLIEIAPVGYMRGRTLNNAFVVIDEAQNCTYTQLKMLLTRLGWNSTMIVTRRSQPVGPAARPVGACRRRRPLRGGRDDQGRAPEGQGTSSAIRWWRRCWACSEPMLAQHKKGGEVTLAALFFCLTSTWRENAFG